MVVCVWMAGCNWHVCGFRRGSGRPQSLRLVRIDLHDAGHSARSTVVCLSPRETLYRSVHCSVVPLLSGAVEALTRIGYNIHFPSPSALGPHCSKVLAITGTRPMLLDRSPWLDCADGRCGCSTSSFRTGRSRWEPAGVILVACVAPVWMTLSEDFHPQDMLAIGLALGGVACVRRGSWVWAGVLLGLAITSQQFSLLVFAPLAVVAPLNRRVRFVGGAIAACRFH